MHHSHYAFAQPALSPPRDSFWKSLVVKKVSHRYYRLTRARPLIVGESSAELRAQVAPLTCANLVVGFQHSPTHTTRHLTEVERTVGEMSG